MKLIIILWIFAVSTPDSQPASLTHFPRGLSYERKEIVTKRYDPAKMKVLLELFDSKDHLTLPDPSCKMPSQFKNLEGQWKTTYCYTPDFSNDPWCSKKKVITAYEVLDDKNIGYCRTKSSNFADPKKWKAPKNCYPLFMYNRKNQSTNYYKGCTTVDDPFLDSTPWCLDTIYATYNKAKYIKCIRLNVWTDWSRWSSCSTTCHKGTISRHRICQHPDPDESICDGKSTETRTCKLSDCPVNGSWGEWVLIGDCSAACGLGQVARYRNCDNPAPKYDGQFCEGKKAEITNCIIMNCTEVGWGQWTKYTGCSITCGFGVKTRTRECLSTSLENMKLYCPGQNSETTKCSSPCQLSANVTKKEKKAVILGLASGLFLFILVICIAAAVYLKKAPVNARLSQR